MDMKGKKMNGLKIHDVNDTINFLKSLQKISNANYKGIELLYQ